MKPSRPKNPPGFQVFADRAGAYRCYHRSTKTPVDCIAFKPYSPEWYAECARIVELHTKKVPKPGTLGKLIAEYRASPSFTDLKPRTQSDYQQCFDFLKPIADTPLIRFDSPLIVRIRDKAAAKHGRRRGNYVKAVLSIVFAWGAERGYLNRNPAASVKNIRRRRDAPEANRPWSDVERHAVWDAMPAHMQPAIALMMYCGLDPQDALALPRSAIKDGHIDTRRGKTAEPVWLPLPSIVVESIAAAPKHDAVTVCATSRGTVWTVSGFRASWRPIRQSLEAAGAVNKGLTLKGLRHTVATILAEIGFNNRAIADLLGQRTEAMAAHYSRRADRTKKNTATVASFEEEVNRRRTKIVKPAD